MKLLTELNSLDNVKDGETRKLVTKATSSGSGNVVSSVSVSGDTITYTKDVTALTAHQNAFSKVKVGSTNVEADAAGDTLELVAGSNITLTPDATNDKVTIAATDTTYTAATTAPGNVASSSSVGTSTNYARQDHTHGISLASGDASGQVKIAGTNVTVKNINNAAYKDIDTSISAASTSTKLPTSQAVASFVEGKGYTTNTGTITGVSVNGTSVATSGVANIATEGIYDESTNKIATMSDLAGCVGTTSSAPNEAGMTGWDYDNGLIYETRITDNNGDKYINITPSGNKMSVNYGTRDNYLEVGNQSLTLASIDYDDDYPVNTTFTTNGGITTLTTQGPGGTGSLDIYSNDTVSLTKINSDNSNSSTVSLSNNKITLYSDTVEVKQAPTTNLGVANKKYVDDAIDALPEPMIFKGSLGTGGTITSLPTASSSNEGYTYKVITAGTYASQSAKVGDTFISDGTAWVLIPSGDEPSGTVTSVTLKATSPIAIDSNSAITSSGTRTLSHANSGVTAGTYKSVTVNATGHVTTGTNPTTISGYGITDAKIASGVITLGSNTITPLTASSTLDATKLSGTIPSGCYTDTKNTAGSTDTSSKIYLIGATSQAANPQTYSDNEVYVTSGVLTTKSVQVGGTAATMQYNSTDKCIEFIFA